jgi:hypothetical protein
MVPIVYSRPSGWSGCTPSYGRIRRWLMRQGLRGAGDFVAPAPVTPAQLLLVHSPEYLRSLRRSRELARILELRFGKET